MFHLPLEPRVDLLPCKHLNGLPYEMGGFNFRANSYTAEDLVGQGLPLLPKHYIETLREIAGLARVQRKQLRGLESGDTDKRKHPLKH